MSLPRRYWLLLLGGATSDVGTQASQTALALYVYRLSGHDATMMGLATAAHLVPGLLATPLGGVLAERIDRRRVMLGSDLARLALVALLGLVPSVLARVGPPAAAALIPTLLLFQALLAAAGAVFLPARQAVVPDLVSPEGLHRANVWNGWARAFVQISGPLLGAWLLSLGDGLGAVLLFDAVTYLASIAALLLIGPVPRPSGARGAGIWADLIGGLLYLRRSPDLRYITGLSLAAGLAMGILIPLLRPFVGEALGGDDLLYGRLIAAFGIGGLLGPALALVLVRGVGLGRTILLGFLGEAVIMAVWSQLDRPMLSGAAMSLWGALILAAIPCQQTYVHVYANAAYHGRTFAVLDQAMFLPQIVGAVLVAMIGNRFSAQAILFAVALGYVLAILATWRTPGARLLRARSRSAPDGR